MKNAFFDYCRKILQYFGIMSPDDKLPEKKSDVKAIAKVEVSTQSSTEDNTDNEIEVLATLEGDKTFLPYETLAQVEQIAESELSKYQELVVAAKNSTILESLLTEANDWGNKRRQLWQTLLVDISKKKQKEMNKIKYTSTKGGKLPLLYCVLDDEMNEEDVYILVGTVKESTTMYKLSNVVNLSLEKENDLKLYLTIFKHVNDTRKINLRFQLKEGKSSENRTEAANESVEQDVVQTEDNNSDSEKNKNPNGKQTK